MILKDKNGRIINPGDKLLWPDGWIGIMPDRQWGFSVEADKQFIEFMDLDNVERTR